MNSINNLILTLILGAFWLVANSQTNLPVKKIDELEYRLLYTRPNFYKTNELDLYINLLDRAANVCYNGVVVQDNRFGYLDSLGRLDSVYFKNLDSFLIRAKSLGLDVFPQAATFVGHQLLKHNPNLAEGLPVKNAPFIVKQDGADKVLCPNDIFPLLNGNFESITDEKYFDNWNIHQDSLNIMVHKSENNTSVLFSRINDPDGQLKIQQAINVIPFRNYHLSVKLKVNNFSNINGVGVSIYEISKNKRVLHYNRPLSLSCNEEPTVNCQLLPLDSVKNNTWVKYDFTFNTLESTELIIALGSWGGGTGQLWWDDLKIEPAGFNNILKREDQSVEVIVKKDNAIIIEGENIDPIIDPLLYGPEGFRMWHEQPIIKVRNNSLQFGDELTIDYFHAGFIHNGISGPSLLHPEIFKVTQKQLDSTYTIWARQNMFKGWFLGHDEIRLHNWENDPPNDTLKTPAKNLEKNFNKIYDQAKAIKSDATIMVWNDMFDPLSNGKQESQLEYPYFFVNGYWGRDSTANGRPDTGIPKDVIIVNWNKGDNIRIDAAKFFANNKHSQILAGYYDPEIKGNYYTDNWLRELEIAKITGIKGIMYTTWQDNFSDLEDWAMQMWGGCPGECNDFETIGNINQGESYGANIQLTATGAIEATDTVEFVSPKKVKLEAGFKFSSDGSNTNVFKAYSGNCPP